MAKITANYEVVYVLDPAQGEEAIAAQVANFKSLAEQNGSDVVMSFTSEPSFPRELDRKLRIAEGVMRSLIVCKGE